MGDEDIIKLRMNLGKFLHNYYIKFGEARYQRFIEKMGLKMSNLYGDAFTSECLRIMEAEYVTFNANINKKNRIKTA